MPGKMVIEDSGKNNAVCIRAFCDMRLGVEVLKNKIEVKSR